MQMQHFRLKFTLQTLNVRVLTKLWISSVKIRSQKYPQPLNPNVLELICNMQYFFIILCALNVRFNLKHKNQLSNVRNLNPRLSKFRQIE